MNDVLAMLLAGGVGSRLNVLAKLRAKPAVPFAGIYRIIDFTLSNVVHSNIKHVGILTQYKPYSLMKHIGVGASWDFIGRNRSAKILPPVTGEKDSDWYQGTADAIKQNISFINRFHPQYTLIVSGDHIYKMNYNDLLEFHRARKADVTIAMIQVPLEMAHHFGIATTDTDSKIIDWTEKPKRPQSNLASMGIYLFNTEILIDHLYQNIGTDFGAHILPHFIAHHHSYAFPFNGYWQDVGTIQSYWEANMDVLTPNTALALDTWNILTNTEEEEYVGDRPPSYISKTAEIKNSLVSNHCIIHGKVAHSILSPGVRIEKGSVVKDSIIMHDCIIGEKSVVDCTIMDKNVTIKTSCMIGHGDLLCPNQKNPDHLNSGMVVIGKNCTLGQGTQIGKNCIIAPYINLQNLDTTIFPCGTTIE